MNTRPGMQLQCHQPGSPLVTTDGKPVRVVIKRVQYICPNCGSTDIQWDASVAWNVKTQQMELAGTQDTANCQTDACGGDEINPIEVELKEST